jgi:hypothetical protein
VYEVIDHLEGSVPRDWQLVWDLAHQPLEVMGASSQPVLVRKWLLDH